LGELHKEADATSGIRICSLSYRVCLLREEIKYWFLPFSIPANELTLLSFLLLGEIRHFYLEMPPAILSACSPPYIWLVDLVWLWVACCLDHCCFERSFRFKWPPPAVLTFPVDSRSFLVWFAYALPMIDQQQSGNLLQYFPSQWTLFIAFWDNVKQHWYWEIAQDANWEWPYADEV